MMGGAQNEWLLWQIADSAFPAGGFAHSGGAEAAFQMGELRGREDLAAFLQAALGQSSSSSLPFVAAGWDGEPAFGDLDGLCDAFTSNHIANRASRLQGQAFLSSVERAFQRAEIKELRESTRGQPTHFAPIFGAIARRLGFEKIPALRLFTFTQLRGWLSSAVRLNVVGPLEAQGLQASLAPAAEAAVTGCGSLEEIAQTAPLLDLFQGCQDRLYSRLFQS